MAANNKKKKGKKGKKGDGEPESDQQSRIAAGIMPSAMFVAVPHPLPYHSQVGKPGMSAGMLSALGCLFAPTKPPPPPHKMSDTDTSLFDYDNTDNQPGYGTYGGSLREGPSGESLGPYYNRQAMHSDGDDEEESDPGYYRTGTHQVPAIIHEEEPVHSEVRKGRPKKPRPPSDDSDMTRASTPEAMLDMAPSTSMRRFLEDDAIDTGGSLPLPRVYTPSSSLRRSQSPGRRRQESPSPDRVSGHTPMGSQRKSPSPLHRNRTPSPDTMDRVESQIIINESTGIPLISAPPKAPNYFPVDDLLHTSSQKLVLLERQGLSLLAKIEDQQKMLQLQQQVLSNQQKENQELLDRLKNQNLLTTQNPEDTIKEIGTLFHSTQSAAEATLEQQDHLISSMNDHTMILDQEKHELQELNEQLQAEINSLRRMVSFKDTGEGGEEFGTQITILKKQLNDFKDERDTLRATIQRLNVELSRYQGKYRPPSKDQGDIFSLPAKGPIPSWLINTKYLAPLFVTYDDQLAEKDEVIKQYEEEFKGFQDQVNDILKENQRLHLRLEQTDISGPMSMTEWRQLQEQCKLVLEENQLLMEQLELQQNKMKEMQRGHALEVSKMSKKIVNIESEKIEMESEVEELRIKWNRLMHQYESSLRINENQLAVEEHINAIQNLKKSQEDEKHKMEHEFENIRTKMQTLQAERKAFALQVEDLKAENKRLEEEIKILHKANRKSERKVLLLQRLLAEVESKEQYATQYLNSIVKVAEKTAEERDTFAQVAQKQEQQKKKAINKYLEETVMHEKMEEKLKAYKMRLSEKLLKAQEKMKVQDEDFNIQRTEYEREIRHLRLLLKEREELLEMMSGDKKAVEDDLEVMWQVAAADNRHMKETMKRSIKKLKEHAKISALLSEETDIDRELTVDILNSEKC